MCWHASGVPDDCKETILGNGEKRLGSKGAGLGLYLVRTLVDSYDGEVRVEDSDRGDGDESAVFVLELPVAENGDGRDRESRSTVGS